MFAGIFEIPGVVVAWLYALTHSYIASIALIAVIIMVLVTPLLLKSTKGMLEMQRLAPELRKLQNEHRNDRQKLNEEMMKLYQEHGVNPMASCLPMLAQMPIFFIMFRILYGLTYKPIGGDALVAQAVLNAGGDTRPIGFVPRYLDQTSELYQSLVRQLHMTSLGLDLSVSPAQMLGQDFTRGLVYAALVAILALLYFGQQRMVAARAAVSPTMSASQQKLMQYLPVFFAVFQIFFLLGLVIYYIVQSILRILQQFYITKRFYAGDESLGRQAQAASEKARELAKSDPNGGGGNPLTQAKRDLAEARKSAAKRAKEPAVEDAGPKPSKRTTPPKNRPTPSSSKSTRASGSSSRPSSSKKRRRT